MTASVRKECAVVPGKGRAADRHLLADNAAIGLRRRREALLVSVPRFKVVLPEPGPPVSTKIDRNRFACPIMERGVAHRLPHRGEAPRSCRALDAY